MNRCLGIPVILLSFAVISPDARGAEKMTDEDRIRLIRGLTAEFASAKVVLPRSKKPLGLTAAGEKDKEKWDDALREHGPSVKPGDQVQITRVHINNDNIVFELNGGLKNGRSWRERIQVGMGTGGATRPIGNSTFSAGTAIELKFDKPLDPTVEVADVKKLLAPLLEFEKRSATESFVESLPPEIQEAIKAQRAVEGMDREQVVLALGRPRYKSRETKDGMETEDWVYGQAPGKITFVTFAGSKVSKVKETYAGVGGGDLSGPPND